MREAPNLKFRAYSVKELSFRISKAMQEKKFLVSFWVEKQPLLSVDLVPYKIELDEKVQLYFSDTVEFQGAESQQKFFYFALDSTHYFGKVVRVDSCDAEKANLVEIDKELHALEGREQERLLAVPHHQIYAYVKLPTENEAPNNVIVLNRIREQKDGLRKFQEKHLGQHQELMGFRVVDISAVGLSFIANEEEYAYFEQKGEDKVSLTLMFNGQSFFIKNAQYVYGTSYVNPRARKLPMYKIGLSFEASDELKGLIREHIDCSSRDPFECHVYENYILGRDEVFKI